MQALLSNFIDRFLLDRRQRLRNSSSILNGEGLDMEPGFRVCDIPVRKKPWLETSGEVNNQWYIPLLARAKQISSNRLDFFDLKDEYLGDPIDWNRDHKSGKNTPMIFSPSLDYRNVKKAGDCKYIWQLNRHHQFVVLGRAYRVSGDVMFAKALADQLESWLDQNPYGIGMNWCSGQELGIRLINWVWALDMIKESDIISEHLQHRILDTIARHIWEIDRKYSRNSFLNTHLISEAAGIFVAASYFNNLKHAPEWLEKSREILNREIINHTFFDGGVREQAISYHLFVLELFVVAGVTALMTDRNFPESYWSRLEKMFEFMATLSPDGDNLPAFGDNDYGYVLDLGGVPHGVKGWLAVGAALFGRSDLKAASGGRISEEVQWLLGRSGCDSYAAVPELENRECNSVAFENTGYYLLQHGEPDSLDCISVVFDCGPLGLEPLGKHGHADALSFTLRAFGGDILVDPGTYDYFSYPKWREYFRGTKAHNTIVIDGKNQSEMRGPFLWGKKAKAECLSWQPTDFGGKVIGQHDGYTYLKDPVTHKRMIDLDGQDIVIRDDIIAQKEHKIEVFFHFAEHCIVNKAMQNCYLIEVGPGKLYIEFEPCLNVESFHGSENPICGWVSRGYHQKEACTTLVGRCMSKGKTCLVCRIEVGKLE